jgi:hypothetical protein
MSEIQFITGKNIKKTISSITFELKKQKYIFFVTTDKKVSFGIL